MITKLLILAFSYTKKMNSSTYCTYTLYSSVIKPSLVWGVGSSMTHWSSRTHQHSNFQIYFQFIWIKIRVSCCQDSNIFSFHGTPELLPWVGVMCLSEILLNFFFKREVHTETWESCRGQNLWARDPWFSAHPGTHPLCKVLGNRLHSPRDKLLDFTTWWPHQITQDC